MPRDAPGAKDVAQHLVDYSVQMFTVVGIPLTAHELLQTGHLVEHRINPGLSDSLPGDGLVRKQTVVLLIQLLDPPVESITSLVVVLAEVSNVSMEEVGLVLVYYTFQSQITQLFGCTLYIRVNIATTIILIHLRYEKLNAQVETKNKRPPRGLLV